MTFDPRPTVDADGGSDSAPSRLRRVTGGTRVREPQQQQGQSRLRRTTGRSGDPLRAGLLQTGAAFQNAASAVGTLVGADEFAQDQRESAEQLQQDAATELQGRVVDVTKIRSVSDALDWLGVVAGTQAPIIGAIAAGGAVGGLAAKAIGAGTRATAAGATAGSVGVGTGVETGFIYPEALEAAERTGQTPEDAARASLVGGSIGGALQALPVLNVFRRFGTGVAGSTRLSRAGRAAAEQAALEGTTEALQETVSRASVKFLDDNVELFGEEGRNQLINALAAGTLLGGGTGFIQGGLSSGQEGAQDFTGVEDDAQSETEIEFAKAMRQAELVRDIDPERLASLTNNAEIPQVRQQIFDMGAENGRLLRDRSAAPAFIRSRVPDIDDAGIQILSGIATGEFELTPELRDTLQTELDMDTDTFSNFTMELETLLTGKTPIELEFDDATDAASETEVAAGLDNNLTPVDETPPVFTNAGGDGFRFPLNEIRPNRKPTTDNPITSMRRFIDDINQRRPDLIIEPVGYGTALRESGVADSDIIAKANEDVFEENTITNVEGAVEFLDNQFEVAKVERVPDFFSPTDRTSFNREQLLGKFDEGGKQLKRPAVGRTKANIAKVNQVLIDSADGERYSVNIPRLIRRSLVKLGYDPNSTNPAELSRAIASGLAGVQELFNGRLFSKEGATNAETMEHIQSAVVNRFGDNNITIRDVLNIDSTVEGKRLRNTINRTLGDTLRVVRRLGQLQERRSQLFNMINEGIDTDFRGLLDAAGFTPEAAREAIRHVPDSMRGQLYGIVGEITNQIDSLQKELDDLSTRRFEIERQMDQLGMVATMPRELSRIETLDEVMRGANDIVQTIKGDEGLRDARDKFGILETSMEDFEQSFRDPRMRTDATIGMQNFVGDRQEFDARRDDIIAELMSSRTAEERAAAREKMSELFEEFHATARITTEGHAFLKPALELREQILNDDFISVMRDQGVKPDPSTFDSSLHITDHKEAQRIVNEAREREFLSQEAQRRLRFSNKSEINSDFNTSPLIDEDPDVDELLALLDSEKGRIKAAVKRQKEIATAIEKELNVAAGSFSDLIFTYDEMFTAVFKVNEEHSPGVDAYGLAEMVFKAARRPGSFFGVQTITADGARIFVNPWITNDALVAETTAHEIGHFILRSSILNLDSKAKNDLFNNMAQEWLKWVKEHRRNDSLVLDITRAKTAVNLYAEAMLTTDKDLLLSHMPAEQQEYLLNFHEWFADNFALWASKKSEDVKSPLHKFFSDVGKKLKGIVALLKERFGFSPNAAFSDYIEGAIRGSNMFNHSGPEYLKHMYALSKTDKVSQRMLSRVLGIDPEGESVAEWIEKTMPVLSNSSFIPLRNFSKIDSDGSAERLDAAQILFAARQQRSTTYSLEAAHSYGAAIIKLLGESPVDARIMGQALSSRRIERQFNKLWERHQGLIEASRNDPVLRLGLIYQGWLMGEIKMSDTQRSIFEKLFDYLEEVFSGVSSLDGAQEIFEKMSMDQWQPAVRPTAGVRAKMFNRAHGKLRTYVNNTLYKFTNAWAYTAAGSMERTGNPALIDLANMFNVRVGREGHAESYTAGRTRHIGSWMSKWHNVMGKATKTELRGALELLQDPRKFDAAGDTREKALANKVRSMLREMYNGYVSKHLDDIGDRGADYFPWVFDMRFVQNNSDRISSMMLQEHFREDIEALGKFMMEQENTRREKGNKLTEPPSNEEVVRALIDGMSQQEGFADSRPRPTSDGFTPKMSAMHIRVLNFLQEKGTNADKDLLTDMFDKNLDHIMTTYIHQAVKRVEFSKRFGENGEVITQKIQEATEFGADETELKMTRDFIEAQLGTYGWATNRALTKLFGGDTSERQVMNPTLQAAMGIGLTMQNMAVLSLATFTSLADVAGILVRTQDGRAFMSAMTVMKREMANSIRASVANIKGENTDAYRSELRQLAEGLGIIENKTTMEALQWEYATTWMSPRLRWVNDKFFDLIGLTWWTRMTRIAGMEGGRQFIKKHALAASEGNETSQRFLRQLNIKAEDVIFEGEGNFEIQFLTSEERNAAMPEEVARDDRLRAALMQFTDEAILRPNASLRPIFFSDPHFSLIFHLKGFMYAFHDRILRRSFTELAEGNPAPVMLVLSFLPLMMAADVLRELMKEAATGERSYRFNQGLGDYTWTSLQRSGLTGKSQLLLDLKTDYDYNGIGLGTFNSALGPAYSNMIEPLPDLFFDGADRGRMEEFHRLVKGNEPEVLGRGMVTNNPMTLFMDEGMAAYDL